MIRNIKRSARWLHRWIGLTLGLVFVGYGLSGSYIVYMDEIEAWLDPAMKRSGAQVRQVTLGELASANALPEGALRIRIPEDPSRNVEFLFNRDQKARLTHYLDPADGREVGQRMWAPSTTGVLYRFHHDLFLGGPGKTVTAIQASMVFAMLLLGLWLWWPRRGERLRALAPTALKQARGTLRTHLELHRWVGIYATLLLLMTVGSGITIARPDWVLSFPPTVALPAGASHYAALDTAFERSGLAPRGSTLRLRDDSVTLYRADGAVYLLDAGKGVFVPRVQQHLSERIYDTIRDIHGGRYFGRYGSAVTFTIGLLPLLFYVTGVVIWWKKRAHRKAAAAILAAARDGAGDRRSRSG